MTPTTPHIPEPTEEALAIAKASAARLRALGATRILLFGSLARGTYVPKESDIDIYFEGIDERKSDLAMLEIVDEFGEDIVDAIPSDCCPDDIKIRVEEQGVPL
jgi:predicted nucleotidyltransferase